MINFIDTPSQRPFEITILVFYLVIFIIYSKIKFNSPKNNIKKQCNKQILLQLLRKTNKAATERRQKEQTHLTVSHIHLIFVFSSVKYIQTSCLFVSTHTVPSSIFLDFLFRFSFSFGDSTVNTNTNKTAIQKCWKKNNSDWEPFVVFITSPKTNYE